jgi:cholesterol transport system auxiliary component
MLKKSQTQNDRRCWMTKQNRLLILFIGLTLLPVACLDLKQPRNKIEYYSLEYDSPSADDLQSLPWVISVQRFSVSPVYNSNRIIYRDKSFQRQAYTYYRWRANPGDLVTYFLRRDLTESGLFKAVLPYDSSISPSHILEGTVDEFLELDGKLGWEAVLAISIAVLDEKEPDISNKILFQKTYRSSKPCPQKNPRALAQAMSLAMSEVAGQIISDIYHHLADRNESE